MRIKIANSGLSTSCFAADVSWLFPEQSTMPYHVKTTAFKQLFCIMFGSNARAKPLIAVEVLLLVLLRARCCFFLRQLFPRKALSDGYNRELLPQLELMCHRLAIA
jgi:hypothetical protein